MPAACGVPEIVPPLLIDRPSGSEPPLRDQVSGVVPPAAAGVVEYASPTVPLGRTEVVTVSAV